MILWDKRIIYRIFLIFLCLGLISGIFFYSVKAETISTSVTISACGNGIVETGEQCDDSNNVSGDGCSSTCQTEGGGGISPPPSQEEVIYYTRVILEGKAYPDVLVNILKDGQFLTSVRADSQGDFRVEIKDLTPGTYTFGVWAEDKYGEKSPTFTITFYAASTTTTTVSGILLPPTIKLSKNSILKSEALEISGQGIPQGLINFFIYSKEFQKEIFKSWVTADYKGDWYYLYDTDKLGEGVYEIKANVTSNKGLISIFSKIVSFELKLVAPPVPPIPPLPPVPPIVGACPGGDLNKDNRVNFIDFSILLYWWGRSNDCADQNGDGIVNLIDFSIMLYWWTG